MQNPLEKKQILTYKDYKIIPTKENNEKLVKINNCHPNIICEYKKQDMLPITGEIIYVRETLVEKLKKAADKLLEIDPKMKLKIVYGYRHPSIQEKYYKIQEKNIQKKHPNLSGIELVEEICKFVAPLDTAGHPTGGAIDLTLSKNNKEVDMGTDIADFTYPEKIKTYSTHITKIQEKNRKILHDILVEQEFAPYYGEWWHFSYGDKEWAAFYNKKHALYSSKII